MQCVLRLPIVACSQEDIFTVRDQPEPKSYNGYIPMLVVAAELQGAKISLSILQDE